MSSKNRLKQSLDEATTLRRSGRFAEALTTLENLKSDPDAHLLGHTTSLGLPRRLHSAFLQLAKARQDVVQKLGLQYHLVPPPELLNKYAGFTHADRLACNQANREEVPRKIHQIWIGSEQAPAGTTAWKNHATAQGYEYVLWREQHLNDLGLNQNTAYLAMLSKGDLPGAVDVARYVILQQFGGIYLDCDWFPVRHDIGFHDLLPMMGLVTMAEETPRRTGKGSILLANSFIAAPKNHPVFARLAAALPDIIEELPKAPAWWSTGPLIFTLMCRGCSVTLADADLVAGKLPQESSLSHVQQWCASTRVGDSGLLLAWRSWAR